MAEVDASRRATRERATKRDDSGVMRAAAPERSVAKRGVQPDDGNPGTQIGTEMRDGVPYVRYRANVGT